MCIRRETREKARRNLAFSRVSKPHTHITHMLRQCTSIVYLPPIFKVEYLSRLAVGGGSFWRDCLVTEKNGAICIHQGDGFLERHLYIQGFPLRAIPCRSSTFH
jgi:hypothetical protein